MKKISEFFKEKDIDISSLAPTIEYLLEGIENIVLNRNIEEWLERSKHFEERLENLATLNQNNIFFSEKIIELKHILDEVIEISQIVLGKIPD